MTRTSSIEDAVFVGVRGAVPPTAGASGSSRTWMAAVPVTSPPGSSNVTEISHVPAVSKSARNV